jgi:hypothetical protein
MGLESTTAVGDFQADDEGSIPFTRRISTLARCFCDTGTESGRDHASAQIIIKRMVPGSQGNRVNGLGIIGSTPRPARHAWQESQ